MPRSGKKPYEKADKRTQELPIPDAKKSIRPTEHHEGAPQGMSEPPHPTSTQPTETGAAQLQGNASTSLEAKQAKRT